jgi:hypothetical protein
MVLGEHRGGETAADPAGEAQRPAGRRRVVHTHEQAPEPAAAVALAGPPAADDELLLAADLDLAPLGGPLARQVAGVDVLRDDPLEAAFGGDGQQGRPVVVDGGDPPVRSGFDERLEQAPAVSPRQAAGVVPVEPQHVEEGEADRQLDRPSSGLGRRRQVHPPLQEAEVGAPGRVEGDDLAVEHGVAAARLGEAGELREPSGGVEAVGGRQRDRSRRQAGQDPHAVPLDLVDPVGAGRGRVGGGRLHRAEIGGREHRPRG